MKRIAVPVVLLAASIPAVGWVWGQNGHRVVGLIAQRHLTPQAELTIRELLDGQSLAQAGTWADEIRSDTSWSCAAPFHYVTLPTGSDYFENLAAGGDVVRAIVYYQGVVSDSTAPRLNRQRALKFLVHMVADMHQPLHIGRGCDLGGNQVQVSWFGEPTNLHSVWDTRLIESQNLSYTELTGFLDRATTDQVSASQHSSPLEWARDSQRHLESVYTCYTGSRGGDRCPCFCGQCELGRSVFGGCTTRQCELKLSGDVQLQYQYAYRNLPIVHEQLLKGGLRLAGLLNWMLADPPQPPPAYQAFKDRLERVAGWSAPFKSCALNR